MKWIMVLLSLVWLPAFAKEEPSSCPQALDQKVRLLHSKKEVNLCSYFQADKPLLVVNTASHCGFTHQFGGLESLYNKYKEQGLVILGFPSNSFKQEEGSEEGTARVCFKNYGVTFPMFEHTDVVGDQSHALFKYLAHESRAPKWNFNKYLIFNGQVVHFGSTVAPLESPLEQAVKSAL